MKVKGIIIALILLCCIPAGVFYAHSTQMGTGYPTYKKAMKEKDTPLLIKELIAGMEEELQKDRDLYPQLIKELQQYTETCTDPASKALLNSMLAQLFNWYYDGISQQVASRTPIVGYVPEDMATWSANLFVDTIQYYVHQSLIDASVLQKTPISTFNVLLTVGADSPALRSTLFDFLSYRAVAILENVKQSIRTKKFTSDIDTIYTRLIAFRKTANNPKALLMVELDYARFNQMQARSEVGSIRYKAVLDSLQQQYRSNDFSVEITIAQLGENDYMPYRPAQWDSVQQCTWKQLKEDIARFPNYERTSVLINKLETMTLSSFNVESDKMVYPGRNLNLKMNYRNLNEFILTIYKSTRTPESYFAELERPGAVTAVRGEEVFKKTFSLNNVASYQFNDTTFSIPMNTIGLYEYEIKVNEKTTGKQTGVVSVSRLFTAMRGLPMPNADVLVTDWETGKPVEGAQVSFYTRQKYQEPLRLLATVPTDKDGLAKAVADVRGYRVTYGKDSALMLSSFYTNQRLDIEKQKIEDPNLSLFSDRAIYRPGQTIFFKGIAYNNTQDNPHVVADRKYTIRLRDANQEIIAEKEFTTGNFGSFNGSFTLPQQTLKGDFSLSTDGGYLAFKVEEYKRPTFAVDFQPLTAEVSFGDTLVLDGTARTFSGVNLQEASVRYRILRQQQFFPRFGSDGRELQVAEGEVSLTEKGAFAISFCPEKETENGSFPFISYRYRVIALITDSKGETEEGELFFVVGEKSLVLSTDVTDKLNKEKASVTIFATNLNGLPMEVSGNYTLFQQEGDQIVSDDQNLVRIPVVKSAGKGSFMSGKPIAAHFMETLPSGRYLLCYEALDSRKRMVTDSVSFVLYSLRDKKPPVATHNWLIPVLTTCELGQEAEFIFGTSNKHARILYEVLLEGVSIERNWLDLSNENRTFRIPYKERFGAGVCVSFTLVKDGKLYTTNQLLTRKQADRTLTIRTETFRDRLIPGQRETWNFRIENADSLPVFAEVLASMYDASLDKIAPHSWFFYPISRSAIQSNWFRESEAFGKTNQYGAVEYSFKKQLEYQYDALDWQGDAFYPVPAFTYGTGSVMMKSARVGSVQSGALMENDVMFEAESKGIDRMVDREESAPVEIPFVSEMPIQIRRNFDETAFFYPSLRTNAVGDVMINFDVPESNTTWKLMLLAYTKTLETGQLTKEAISQKKLMVLPNLPRFMRQGDQVSISTQISNLAEKEVSGRVRIELFNPATDEIVVCLTKSERMFTLAPGATTATSWLISVPKGIDLIGCRIIAETPDASDGEQQLIPVLPSELMMLESVPFTVLGSGEKTVKTGWSALSSTARPFRMTLEYTNNPIWYAVQAVPSITVPEHDDLLSIFAAYYGNTLASYIVHANPRIQAMIDGWVKNGGNSETLYSNLEKNSELKSILLQETPWVLEAANETEQKQRLALLFNLNNTSVQQKDALNKLIAAQYPDGGWSWYKEMPASRFITLSILKGMSKLTQLGAIEYGESEKRMQLNALRFLDKAIQQDFEVYKKTKNNRLDGIGIEQLEYLFVRSNYRDVPEDGGAREAIRYYTVQAEKNWRTQSLYGKALTAQLLFRNGNKQLAQTILNTLRKLSTQSAVEGMYWANNRESLNFMVAPVSVHCQLMQAFSEITPDQKETDLMKLWLLKQKQTQYWSTIPATMDAIASLLQTGTNWLNDTGNTTLTWGNHTYDASAGEAGTGYVQESVAGAEITSGMETITLKKESAGPAWGAVYRQYFEKLENIQAHGGVLSVEKKLFVEEILPTGRVLHLVTAQKPLKVGDKVMVRLVIRADRTMDYVQLKDLRAGCFEPVSQLSGFEYRDGLGFYRSPQDVSENYFFDHLPKGTYVMEYAVYVSRSGQYAGGISTIQCLYAPEFVAHTGGNEILVQE